MAVSMSSDPDIEAHQAAFLANGCHHSYAGVSESLA